MNSRKKHIAEGAVTPWLSGAALATAIMLGGCSNSAPTAAQLASPGDCGASLLQDRMGDLVSGTSASDVRVGGNPVQSRGLVRVYVSGQPVTHDYREARLNLETDASGKLVAASCG